MVTPVTILATGVTSSGYPHNHYFAVKLEFSTVKNIDEVNSFKRPYTFSAY